VIEITRSHNSRLHEKAGREGFRENRAYRQFREILKNFFVQVAADFFRDDSSFGRYEKRRAELSRLDKAKRRREKLVSARRKEFRDSVTARSADFASGAAAQRINEAITTLDRNLRVAETEPDPDRSAQAFLHAESMVRQMIGQVRDDYRLSAPRGIGLPGALRRDFEAYRQEYEHFAKTAIDPALNDVERRLTLATGRAKVAIDRRLRFENALKELTDAAKRSTNAQSQTARSAADDVRLRVGELARASMQEVEQAVGGVLSRAAVLDVSTLDDDAFVAQRTMLETDVERATEDAKRALSAVVTQLRTITDYLERSPSGDISDTTNLDAEEALEEEVIALRERSEADLELAQLGIAVQVINHEFDATIRTVRRNIRQLRAWADANDKLRDLYESIRDSFSHLDGYLTLFTPLQRRLYRSVVKITGADILRFLEDLFAERLKRHQVRLLGTRAFRAFTLTGYPSTFYPVFVNLIDNAIFWVTHSKAERTIRLDASGDKLIVSDSGPGVDPADRDVIFDFGFSRKPSGRGLGLHISRDVLARSGYRLFLNDERSDLGGAMFTIAPVSGVVDENEKK
jgi:signal transduction histidine kinase